ncbi:hypothetical protein [Azohydromonas aeria]|uniref:hypothetical protein n=1 Tax=Azohydromonas aeria TaxID=2590212 RepID=UPI0012FB5FF7|nr:hypothetical protein [Azohydromonas aeria]
MTEFTKLLKHPLHGVNLDSVVTKHRGPPTMIRMRVKAFRAPGSDFNFDPNSDSEEP